MMIPIVIQKSARGELSYDIYSAMLANRIIYLGEPIDDEMSNLIVMQLLYLDSQSHDPIKLLINSGGGSVSAGFQIIDVMDYIKSPVDTYSMGISASMASLILSNGSINHRYGLSNTSIMVHQPKGGIRGQSTDVDIQADELHFIKNRLTNILAKNCNQEFNYMASIMERDFYMTAEEGKELGIIDRILTRNDILFPIY